MREMKENSSPPAEFEFDDDHSYFMVRLPVQSDAPQVPGYGTTVVGKHVYDHPGTDH